MQGWRNPDTRRRVGPICKASVICNAPSQFHLLNIARFYVLLPRLLARTVHGPGTSDRRGRRLWVRKVGVTRHCLE